MSSISDVGEYVNTFLCVFSEGDLLYTFEDVYGKWGMSTHCFKKTCFFTFFCFCVVYWLLNTAKSDFVRHLGHIGFLYVSFFICCIIRIYFLKRHIDTYILLLVRYIYKTVIIRVFSCCI